MVSEVRNVDEGDVVVVVVVVVGIWKKLLLCSSVDVGKEMRGWSAERKRKRGLQTLFIYAEIA